jgi:hypothetical protein
MTEENFNPDLNKFESRDDVTEQLMNVLAKRIQDTLPGNFRFALFLFQEVEEDENVHVFYCASARTDQLLPLMEVWINRQKN